MILTLCKVGQAIEGLPINLTELPLEPKLFYDTQDLKEVPFVKITPMTYKSQISDSGTVQFEIRLMVLSSQMEDLNFRIRLTPIDPLSKLRLEEMSVLSEPIKVVSKPEQARRESKTTLDSNKKGNKKRVAPASDSVADVLNRLETQVSQQQQLLVKLTEATQLNQAQNQSLLNLMKSQPIREEVVSKPLDIESAFAAFLEAYNNTEPQERPSKMNKIAKLASSPFLEDIKLVCMEKNPMQQQEDSICHNCSHKNELDRLENFFTIMSGDEFIF